MYNVILGVDGGGTHSKIVAVDLEGHILARDEFGSLNYNSESVPVCRKRLQQAVANVLEKAGRENYDFLSVGLSALQGKATCEKKRRFLGGKFDMGRVYLNSDIYMALTGASLGRPEIMIVSGTGAMGIGRDQAGGIFTCGGYGYLVDNDRGSSYYIAMNGIIAAIDSAEGTGPKTALEEAVLEQFGIKRVQDIVYKLYARDYHISQGAAFARTVIALARQGDAVAAGIVEKNLDILVQYAVRLAEKIHETGCGINLYGGLFQYNAHLREAFTRKVAAILPDAVVKLPRLPAEIGAVIEWFLQNGLLTQSVIDHLSAETKGDDGIVTGLSAVS